jgi:hypothetical protein
MLILKRAKNLNRKMESLFLQIVERYERRMEEMLC